MKEIKLQKNFYENSQKKCFILGTGPSIETVPFDEISDHILIGVNLIMFSGCIPDFICISDRDMIVDNYDEIINEKMDKGFYLIARPKNMLTELKLKSKSNVLLIDGFKEKKPIRPPFLDPELKTFAMTKNGVINDLAVSLAVFLGFNTIHFLGVDGEHGPKSHFYDHKATKKQIDSVIRGPRSPTSYDLLLPILKEKNVTLLNCNTNGNKIEGIENKNLQDVLNENS